MDDPMAHSAEIPDELNAQAFESVDGEHYRLKSGLVQCLLQKFGTGAEHTYSPEDGDQFKVYADPDNVEEGEVKESVSCLGTAPGDEDMAPLVVSSHEDLPNRFLTYLQQCLTAQQTTAGRRKSGRRKTKKTKKSKKSRKHTRRM